MEIQEIKLKLESSIDIFLSKDKSLLQDNVNERSIAFRLSHFMIENFSEYDVDCEYNRNLGHDKVIRELRRELQRINQLSKRETDMDLEGLTTKSVLPDIIVHKRNTANNLLIIEIKKSSNKNKLAHHYDLKKLKLYTSNQHGNNLNYQIGVFIEFNTTNSNEPLYKICWFMNGRIINLE